MIRNGRASVAMALLCAVAGAALVGCEEASTADSKKPSASSTTGGAGADGMGSFTGTKKIKADGRSVNVSCSGDPVEVIQHGKRYLAAVPEYGAGLERAWTRGQEQWLAVSGSSKLSTAENSEHYIYVDEPDVAVGAIRRVASQAADA
ncbi:hypothetical protein [Streptomyces niveus]|uniref:hypothetical protein n=1 Tax=Streptomyces niveus TaxID=193462 RepID=UPI00369E6C5A